MRSGVALTGSALAAVLALSACAAEQAGKAQPAGGATTESSPSAAPGNGGSDASLPHSGAPKVANPLDVSEFLNDPCRTLTRDQVVNELGLKPNGEKKDEPFGPRCRWGDPAKGSAADVFFLTGFDEGLSQVYATRDNAKVFYPMEPIGGYPMVVAMTADSRDLGSCVTNVGLSDKLSVQISARVSRERRGELKPCEDGARMVAELAITTMKRGS